MPGAVGSWRSRSVALHTLTKYASEELCPSVCLSVVIVPWGVVRPCPVSDQQA